MIGCFRPSAAHSCVFLAAVLPPTHTQHSESHSHGREHSLTKFNAVFCGYITAQADTAIATAASLIMQHCPVKKWEHADLNSTCCDRHPSPSGWGVA